MLDYIYNVDLILGNNASNYTKPQKSWALDAAKGEVEAYIGRRIDFANYKQSPPEILEGYNPPLVIDGIGNEPLFNAFFEIAAIKLYRLGTEGLASQSYSGVSETFLDGYPAHITAVLKRYRKIKVIG